MSQLLVVSLVNGASARVTLSDGDRTTIESTISSPPGSTLRGQIEGISCEFQLKVRSCRKTGEKFTIDGRVINASRQMRETLRNHLSQGAENQLVEE
jgi:hypothetical protein